MLIGKECWPAERESTPLLAFISSFLSPSQLYTVALSAENHRQPACPTDKSSILYCMYLVFLYYQKQVPGREVFDS